MKVIEVIPNPYIALDKDGVPQGAVSAGMPGVYVGAQVDIVATRKTGKMRFFFPGGSENVERAKTQKIVGGMLAVKVAFTADMVASVRAGELLAVTKESAALCGISEKEYLEPEAVLASEAEKALAYLKSAKGDAAKLGEIPHKATPEDASLASSTSVQLTPTTKLVAGPKTTTKTEG